MSIPNDQQTTPAAAPQIKICGLTRIDEAVGCARLGAAAIGFVFYARSPRCITPKQAAEIIGALPPFIKTVGVFVNESFEAIMKIVMESGLNAVQLHGQETPEMVCRLRAQNLLVIKALFTERQPEMSAAAQYNASAYLIECGQGTLPGGNARVWKWEDAKDFGKEHPLILAGGLSPENIEQAIAAAKPDAVDVSSGVESAPGRKDLDKVEAFINAVSRYATTQKSGAGNLRRIF